MKFLVAALAFSASFSASAAVIEAKSELHILATQPAVEMKAGVCQITGAVVVNGELVKAADIGLRAEKSPDLIARTKTNDQGVYTLAVKVPVGTLLQEIVVSNPDKAGKVAAFPGQVIACK